MDCVTVKTFIQIFTLLAIKVIVAHAIYCGNQYVSRGHLCCKPIFNCKAGHEIVQCTQMYAEERCQACPDGHVQPDYISSLDNSRSCFVKQEDCTAYDITYSTPRKNCYPKHCKCNIEKCFIDDHCVCVKVRGCPINQTLDPSTRECKPCPRFSYKNQIGCGPCIMDTDAWRLDKQLQDDMAYNDNTKGSTQPREGADCQIKLKRAERRIAKLKRKLRKQKRQLSRLQRKWKRIGKIRSSIILSNGTRVFIHQNA